MSAAGKTLERIAHELDEIRSILDSAELDEEFPEFKREKE
jgi:hypothetical protein